MGQYILRRLVYSIFTLFFVTVVVFVLLRVIAPLFIGDVVDLMVAEYAQKDPLMAEKLRTQYGFNQNFVIQYTEWAGSMLKGDFGRSLYTQQPVLHELIYRAPVSLELSLIALSASLFLAVPMGILSAIRQDRWPDYVLRIYAVGANSFPSFWIAIMVITLSSLWFNWSPPIDFKSFATDPIQHIRIMALPALLIALTPSGGMLRIMRSQMLEVLRQDYVRTARAKGLKERTVILRHAVRNAIIPVVTILGLSLPALLGGTALFEIIFVLPGIGRYLVTSVNLLDYPVIQSINVVFALIIIMSNLTVDVAYSLIDPRIRY